MRKNCLTVLRHHQLARQPQCTQCSFKYWVKDQKKVYVNSRKKSSSIATTEVGAMMWAVNVLENILRRRDIDIDHKVAKLFSKIQPIQMSKTNSDN